MRTLLLAHLSASVAGQAPLATGHAAKATVVYHGTISYWQAIVLGLIQGVTELFPVSSLGHTVILPELFGWKHVVVAESQSESFWLPFVVGLHVGTAIALLVYFFRTWIDIIAEFFRSIYHRRIENSTQRLAWLLVVATIPVGAFGLVLEHPLRVIFTKPLAASIFLIVNAFILFFGEEGATGRRETRGAGIKPKRQLDNLNFREAAVIGFCQIGSLFAGVSRSGITMVAGLVRGLNHEDSARFAFLLATPIILAAGVLKLPDLTGSLGNGIRGPDHRRGGVRIRGGADLGAVPLEVLPDEDTLAFCRLLPRGRHRLHVILRLSQPRGSALLPGPSGGQHRLR